jgi:hypothetical protein
VSADWWASALPFAPVVEQPRGDAAAYRAHVQQTRASAIYREGAWHGERVQQRAEIYDTTTYLGLEQYASATHRSKWLPADGESAANYVARLRPVIGHLEDVLPAEEYAEVVGAWNVCVEAPDTFEAFRSRLDSKQSGESVGMFGQDAKAMATELHTRDQAAHQARFGNPAQYESIAGVNIRRPDIAGVLKAEDDARSAALQARYAHNIVRPSGDGFIVTTA